MPPRAKPSLPAVALALAAIVLGARPASSQSVSVLSMLRPEGTLTIGSDHAGNLSPEDGTFPLAAAGGWEEPTVNVWLLRGRAGLTVTIDLISEAFDAQLLVIGPGLEPQTDDDSGGACNARLTLTLPTADTYTVAALSYRTGEYGPYVLRVAELPRLPAQGACGQPPPPEPEGCDALRRMMWLALAEAPGGGPNFETMDTRERVACESGAGRGATARWPNGVTMSTGDSWLYPNGQTAIASGTWYYPNGQPALFAGTWQYPNGQPALFAGNWYLPDGRAVTQQDVLVFALDGLAPERAEILFAAYREAPDTEWATLILIVMASEASRR